MPHGKSPPLPDARIRQIEKQGQRRRLIPADLPPYLSLGLALPRTRKGFMRLPSGRSLREAKVRHLEVGPLHNFPQKA